MKRILAVYLLLLILISQVGGCKKQEIIEKATLINKDTNKVNQDDINHYAISLKLDDEEKSYRGQQYTTYVNNTGKVLKEIYFHIYPNAFKGLKDAPILFSKDSYSVLDYVGGFIDILDVSIGSSQVNYQIQGQDDTILYIELEEPLLIGQRIVLYMEYRVKLPTSKDRFGYGERTINFGNWYPIACVYDENGWNIDPYYNIGDPFYLDIANYNISINVGKDMVIASSGNILSDKISGQRRIYEIEGKLIRDFAWVASEDFKIAEREVDGSLIRLYYLDKKPVMVENGLRIGEDSLKTFNRIFGQYPYGIYSIVMTEFPSGMEYPGLVFIGEQYFSKSFKDMLEQIIVHETAHQWWYGLVGNNQVKEAWLDEGLTTYSEIIYYKELYGKEKSQEYFTQNIETGYDLGVAYLLGSNNIVNKPLWEFQDWNDYSILVYSKAAMFIRALEERFGEEVLYKILNCYFERFKFDNATSRDFINICQEVTEEDIGDLVNKWLY